MFFDILGFLVALAILWRIDVMAGELARLQAEVAENSTVIESASVLIANLAQQIRDNATDPAALTALADELDTNSNKLAAAVAANTPATEEGAVEEVPVDDLEPIEEAPAEPAPVEGEGTEGEQPTG